jgi:transcriptional regulator with XRE-family HTH domain
MIEQGPLSLLTPGEAGRALAARAKALRLQRAWTRDTLASRAGVTPASLKRFETTGAASLDLVLRISFALGRLEDFTQALELPPAATMAELLERDERPARRRGTR